MKGPFHYIEKKISGESSLDTVLVSDDERRIKAVRPVAVLFMGVFAAATVFMAKEAVGDTEQAYRSSDSVAVGVESFVAADEVAAGGIAGWIAAEMGMFLVDSTRKVRELQQDD